MHHDGRCGRRIDRLVAIDQRIERRPNNVDGSGAVGGRSKQLAIGEAGMDLSIGL